jgi:mannose-6-phosphate isomerase-like protein (cupin superfamily)
VHLDAVLASFASGPDEVVYQDCASGPGYSAGIVRFLPRETDDARMVTHEAKDVVCHVISGDGLLRIGDEVQEIGPGTLCQIPARTPHDFRAMGEPMVMFVTSMDVAP